MKNTMIISAFAGTGKTTLSNIEFASLEVLDLDSSTFSKCEDFPSNYADAIQDAVGMYDIVLISTHDAVREELLKREIPFTIVYPDPALKELYRERYERRGSSAGLIECVMSNWAPWIEAIEQDTRLNKYKMTDDRFLSTVLLSVKQYHEAKYQQ